MEGCGAAELPAVPAREVLQPCAHGRGRGAHPSPRSPRCAPSPRSVTALPRARIAGAPFGLGANLVGARSGMMSPVVPVASPGTNHGVRSAKAGGKSRCCRRPPGPGRGSPSQPRGRRRCAAGTASALRFPQPSKSSLLDVPESLRASTWVWARGSGSRSRGVGDHGTSNSALLREVPDPRGLRCPRRSGARGFVSLIAQSPERSHFPARCLNWIFSKYSPGPPSARLRCGNGDVLL